MNDIEHKRRVKQSVAQAAASVRDALDFAENIEENVDRLWMIRILNEVVERLALIDEATAKLSGTANEPPGAPATQTLAKE